MGKLEIEVDGKTRTLAGDDASRAVEEVLEEVRPALAAHGGDASLVGIEGTTARIKLHGACNGCPMSAMTFGIMVDEMIKQKLPEITEVVYE